MTIRNDLLETLAETVDPGLTAITIQPFTELNSKTGTQYEASFFLPSLAPGASSDISLAVGNNPVIIKDIQLQFTSERLSITGYRSPTFTGGLELPVYNLFDGNAIPDDVLIMAGVVTTNTGTQISPTVNSLGSASNNPNNSQSSIGTVIGVERILQSNTTYLYRITNEDTSNSTAVAGIATWYQGPISNQG